MLYNQAVQKAPLFLLFNKLRAVFTADADLLMFLHFYFNVIFFIKEMFFAKKITEIFKKLKTQ